MHIALGRPCRGRRIERGDVLHIACEGVRGLAARKKAWRPNDIQNKDPDTIAARSRANLWHGGGQDRELRYELAAD
jgi:hypothetical protein